jgi:hypothetical protein
LLRTPGINPVSIELIKSEAHISNSICIGATGFRGVFIKNSEVSAIQGNYLLATLYLLPST